MRFVFLLAARVANEANAANTSELAASTKKFNEDLTRSGVLLAAEWLQSNSKATRIRVSGGKRVVIDGPFTDSKDAIAGFWMLEVKSTEEAIEWATRCPLPEGGMIEVRQARDATAPPHDLRTPTADA